MSTALGIERIMKILPHRYPMLLVDRVEKIDGNSIVGIKNVTINEPFFQGHFPIKPVMPGVLIVEALAQISGILVFSTSKYNKTDDKALESLLIYFLSIESAKFRIPVEPGDTMELHSKILYNKSSIAKCDCEAIIRGKKVAEAIISAKVVL